jgi:hypothetical protein
LLDMPLYSVLAVRCAEDALLHHLAAIGLAASRGVALVVDLDRSAPAYPGRLTVRDLLDDGVRRAQLSPAASGVAVLGNGDAEPGAAVELIEVLAAGWPAIVVRAGSDPDPFSMVPVSADFPAIRREAGRNVRPRTSGVSVGGGRPGPDDDILLPPLRRSQVRAMLNGHIRPGWRWVKAWRSVWDVAWG